MEKAIRRFSLVGMIILVSLVMAACQPKQQSITPAVPGISVTISGNTCPGVVVQAGDQVTWTNQDSREHIVQHLPEEGESQFNSGILKPQDRFVFTFMEPGSYPYECAASGAVRGLVIVEP